MLSYKAYRFYIGSGYIEIEAATEQEARERWRSDLVTMKDKHNKTFVCLHIPHNVKPEVIEE